MTSFREIGINDIVLKAIDELGFQEPTPVQEKSIPTLLDSQQDLVALAQTGTGKTAAFGLPLIQLTDTQKRVVQSFVLCPTRELCIQITKDLHSYAKFIKDLRIVSVYGGANISEQIKKLKKGAHIVVGTPGRVIDLIDRKALKIDSIKWLVFDEADEMLNRGFKEDLDQILLSTPEEKQTLLFSATMPKEIAQIAKSYMNNPKEISVATRNEGSKNISHQYYVAHARDRYQVLKRIADINPNIYGIVFCRTRRETQEIADKLIADGYNADSLHGDLSQTQRDQVMNKFRRKNLHILVATDVAARGLDVNELSHVINFNLPDDLEVYVHRSGRTGRAGNKGVSIAILHMKETRKIRDIERLSRIKFEKKQIPSGAEVCEKQLFNLIDRVEQIEVNTKQIEEYLPKIYKKLEWLSREELIQHFVSVEFNRFLEYYKNARDLNTHAESRKNEDHRGDRQRKKRSSENYTRFFINLGQRDDLVATKLIGLINEHTRKRNLDIGKIDILKSFSFFEVDRNFDDLILESLNKKSFNNQTINVEISKEKPKNKFQKKRNTKERRNQSRKRY